MELLNRAAAHRAATARAVRAARAARAVTTRAAAALAAALLLAAAPGATADAGEAPAPAAAPPAAVNPPGVHVLQPDGRIARHVDCPAGWICLYDGPAYDHGAVALLPGTALPDTGRLALPDGTRFTGRQGFSAWVNNSPAAYCWYPARDFGGTAMPMAPDSRGNAHDDALASLRPC
ncbi:peptidase inhibitor family I36 protein [Kitasatospora sp. NPDC088391]|uniref:peptidase inhibitor family I36 protein n=1 Tax=Kitasatospora sp. NPDC088391 TaxID=3364074 RepID=UPI00382DB11F